MLGGLTTVDGRVNDSESPESKRQPLPETNETETNWQLLLGPISDVSQTARLVVLNTQ